MPATRRSVLSWAAALPALAPRRATAAGPGVGADLARYAEFGVKASGGPGDAACGEWVERRLRDLGYDMRRQTFDTPFFEPARVDIRVDGKGVELRAQEPARTTGADGLEAPLVISPSWEAGDVAGKIMVAPLPYRRWSSSLSPEVATAVDRARRGGAAGLILVTDGPTGQAVALNARPDMVWPCPMAVVGPRAGGDLVRAAAEGRTGRLTIAGRSGRRPAFNVIGRLDRGYGQTLVLSTPRSGWTVCAGERGSGLAAWLALAAWAVRGAPHDLLAVCTSGHEYEHQGSHHFLSSNDAPQPARTALWAHIGANLAARDWHEGYGPLRPLTSVDPQRVLVATGDIVDTIAPAVRGLPGLERVYDAGQGAAGELAEILAAGYPRVFGVFGAHRFHHVAGDDLRCVEASHVAAATKGLQAAVSAALV